MIRSFLIFASFLLPLFVATAEGNAGRYSEIRAEYVRLRNIDPSTEDPGVRPLWKQLKQKMEHVAKAHSDPSDIATARFAVDYATLLARIYRVEDTRGDLQPAKHHVFSALTWLKNQSSKDSLISDLKNEAVLLYGDILLLERDFAAAKEFFTEEKLSKTDVRRRSRLQSIQNETYEEFMPASELETPTILSLYSRGEASRKNQRIKRVVIDPGHGGDDVGAVGKLGLLEKELTLDISQRVARILEERGIRVILTRESDSFIPLARRTQLANHLGAAAFISIHHNASPSHQLEGLESFYLDNTDDQAGKKLADRENSAGISGAADDIDFMLSDLIQSGKMEDSIRLTQQVNASLSQSLGSGADGVKVRGVKKAPFYVLVGAHMPCTLLELLFVDNAQDAERLSHPRFLDRIANAIARGIITFLGKPTSQEISNKPRVESKKRRR